jgi:hypothetical protein
LCYWECCKKKAIADVEKAVIDSLEKQYADILAPIKDCIAPKKFGLKYVQKLTKRNSTGPYIVPEDVSFATHSHMLELQFSISDPFLLSAWNSLEYNEKIIGCFAATD